MHSLASTQKIPQHTLRDLFMFLKTKPYFFFRIRSGLNSRVTVKDCL